MLILYPNSPSARKSAAQGLKASTTHDGRALNSVASLCVEDSLPALTAPTPLRLGSTILRKASRSATKEEDFENFSD